MKNETVIEFKNISKNFGAIKALKDVSFQISKGECHAIVGENGAGKSTLMNILSGIYRQDEGEVVYNGENVKITSPTVASNLGIATVYQELKLCPNLTAVENIYLGRTATTKLGIVKKMNMDSEAKKLLDIFEIDIDLNVPIKNLSIAQMQLVELAKALSKNADVLILDEPTSSLTNAETDILFDLLQKLKTEGRTIIFISHRLTEIFQIADRLSVMRDGQYLGTFNCCDLTENKIVELIAGDKLIQEEIEAVNRIGEDVARSAVAMEVKNLNRGKQVKDISFKLFEGEILGFYGLQGAGRTELVETIFGLYPCDSGEILIKGRPVCIKNPSNAIAEGIGLITEDRKNRGVFSKMNISENIMVLHNKAITKIGFYLDNKKIKAMTEKYHKELSIKMENNKQNILNLSGGNQQKVIIGRILSNNPDIILADEPTRGVDVGAKAEIFSIFHKLKKQGKAIIIISSELKEVVTECDRILVIRNGKIVGEVTQKENRKEQILQFAFNG
jgi:ABC-type sugar transport system, ATPase component